MTLAADRLQRSRAEPHRSVGPQPLCRPGAACAARVAAAVATVVSTADGAAGGRDDRSRAASDAGAGPTTAGACSFCPARDSGTAAVRAGATAIPGAATQTGARGKAAAAGTEPGAAPAVTMPAPKPKPQPKPKPKVQPQPKPQPIDRPPPHRGCSRAARTSIASGARNPCAGTSGDTGPAEPVPCRGSSCARELAGTAPRMAVATQALPAAGPGTGSARDSASAFYGRSRRACAVLQSRQKLRLRGPG